MLNFLGSSVFSDSLELSLANHSNEPPKAEIVCANGLHDFLSFISIAPKETFHISWVQATKFY